MSSHPTENRKPLVNEEESKKRGIRQEGERVGRQREREKEEEKGRERLWQQTSINLTFLFQFQEMYSTGSISTDGQNYKIIFIVPSWATTKNVTK